MKNTSQYAVVAAVSTIFGVLMFCLFAGLGCNHDKEIEQRNTCISNLRIISAAKNQWAVEKHKAASDIPTWADIQPYLPPFDRIKDSKFGTNCPAGGKYTLGPVDQEPTCSISDHKLP
jgi:hypothetical protein